MNKRTIGTEHEQMACEYLEKEGLEIIETNYRVKIGEIDIIAKDGYTLVFAEVKYRASKDYGGASFAISTSKQQKIYRVAQWYISAHHLSEKALYRFDAILIDGEEITHIKNAW